MICIFGSKKYLLVFVFLLISSFAGLFAAPLSSGHPMAPTASASPQEREQAFVDARRRVLDAAMTYLGTPYRLGGKDRRGLDCSGFVYVSFKDALGVSLPRTSRCLYAWTERIPGNRAQPGDLLFFRTTGTNRITHVAIYIGNGRFIHSASVGRRTGVIITHMSEGSWTRNFAGAGRAFPAIADSSLLTVSDASGAPEETGSSSPANVPTSISERANTHFLIGIGVAPSWNGFLREGGLLRLPASNCQQHYGKKYPH